MALFEFEDGHLVPAQFGYPVAQDLGPELIDAICQQVLQIVSRPLFPVTWRDMTGQGDEETPRLTALDVSGQIVSVEILKELDSETLITSLSRLAEVASISWSDLASEYPSGPEGFRAGWAQFRDSMPPAVGPGPRLIIVAGEIDPSVRPALSILATSGVEVHLMNLRQMSNGRLFLDVNAVGPRLYGHAPQLLASASAAPEIVAPTQEDVEEAEASVESDSETPTTRPTPKVAPHLRDVFTYPIDEEPPAPWRPASEEDEQDEAETADALDCTEAPEQGEASERDDAAEEGVDALTDEWAPVGEVDAQDEHEATEQDAGDDHVEDAEHVDGDAVAEDGDEYAHESVEADHAEDAEADAQDTDERDADAHAKDVPESGEHEGDEARAAEHSENKEAGELLDREEARAEESAEADEDTAADDHTDDHTAASVGDHAETETEPDAEGDDVPEHTDEQASTEAEAPRWEPPAHMSRRATRRARVESSELNDGGATEAATASFVDRADESPEVVQARAKGLPVLGRDESGLRTLAQILGEDTPLVARGELGLPGDLVLAASGAVSGAGLTYPSLDTLLTARGLGHIDVWGQVRIGDRLGPTLAEALDEVNREIVREYAQAPRGHRSAKH